MYWAEIKPGDIYDINGKAHVVVESGEKITRLLPVSWQHVYHSPGIIANMVNQTQIWMTVSIYTHDLVQFSYHSSIKLD